MKANSLAFRLFVTAAAWVLVVLPIAGWIIFARYRHEIVTAFDARISCFLTVVISDADRASRTARPAQTTGARACSRSSHSGWYWQIKPLDGKLVDGKPAEFCSRSLAGDDLPLPSENSVEPNEKEIRWANLTGPAQQRVRVAEKIYQFGEGKSAQRYSVAVGRQAERGGGQSGRVPLPAHSGAGARRRGPAGGHAVPGPLRPVPAVQGGAGRWPRSARARPPGWKASCRPRSSPCSRSSTRS